MVRQHVCAVVLAVVTAAGCRHRVPPPAVPPIEIVRTERVEVPVPVKVVPPAELLAPIASPVPVFVQPAAADASSALTADGERKLRALIADLLGRLAAWKAWATAAQ